MTLLFVTANYEMCIPNAGSVHMAILRFRKVHKDDKIDNVYMLSKDESGQEIKTPVEDWEKEDY